METDGNASSIEASICPTKAQRTLLTHDKELLTVDEMHKRGIAPQKIQAVVSKGGGVADPDLPQDASLMKFWVATSTKWPFKLKQMPSQWMVSSTLRILWAHLEIVRGHLQAWRIS